MEKEESSFYFNNKSIDNSTEVDTGLFNNIFIVHNIQLVWNQAVRNVIFKMVHLNNRINLLHNNMTYKLDKEMMKITNYKHSNHNSYESLDDKMVNTPITFDEHKKRDSYFNIILNNDEKLDIDNNSNIADDLLKKLISEQNTHFVVTEHDNNTDDEDTIEFPEIQSKSDTYISSRNESSPDYISPYEKAINSTLINFINPEVCFEVGVDYVEKDKELGLILLVAKSAQYRSISITDLDVEDCNNVKDEEIIKKRLHVAIQDAQLNTTHKSKRNKFPLTLVLNTSDGKLQWPLWVPLECIFDPSSHCGIMEHVADSFSGNWLSDSYNSSYVKPLERLTNNKNNKKKNNNSSSNNKPDGVNNSTKESEDKKVVNGTLKLKTKVVCVDNDNEIDTNIIAIKECNLFATSLQFCTIYSVICNLFSYTEPGVLKMDDNVQKLVFRIEQLDDLNDILENIYLLKSNIRTLKQSIVRLEWNNITHEFDNLSNINSRSQYKQLQNQLYETQDDLLYVVLALKKINKQRNSTKKNSTKIKSKFIYMSKDLTLNMLLDNMVPYCECIFKDLKFQIDTLDDKTNINTVELRRIIVHNLLEKDNVYMKALGPYLPHQRELLENTKEKMFRLYYRENPAIGGIPIIDHFEINLIPILVQITNKLVNHLLWYIFPDKYKHHTSMVNLYADIDQEKLDCSDIDSIIYYSYQQTLKAEKSMSERKSKKKSSKSNTTETENDILLSDNELSKNNGSGNISDDEGKEYKYNYNSDGDILSDHDVNSTNLKDKNKKFGSSTALNTIANSGTSNGKGDNKIEYNVNQMQNRASQNKTFVYIKIPGAHHCISYKGPKDKNISDIFQFTFKFPTLEYRNKTWSWYEFLMAVKKDLTKTVLNHVASLMKEKIFKRKLNEKESNKMFGMLDEQIMYKFKKYYKNRSSNSSNASNYSMVTSSTLSTINSNSLSESTYDDINYLPEVNEEDLNMEYVHELQKELYNDPEGHDSDGNITHNMSKDLLDELANSSSPTPTNSNKTKSKQTKNNAVSSKSAKTLPRNNSMDVLDANFPTPSREGNTRSNELVINNSTMITSSMQSINVFSTVSNDYNEYMFIKKRMLFGKYMDDK
ncbi:hypothetical protein PIROE2DRAFT_68434 [Piromyces sp. E2]|nr:hypothetical protein PIROE2DRAFT_68434 [Piromyces sp. E2]|eukprot:OUM70269.1 hypothetical protein PIROE2DRAFT_68434 [Piromyces sp. E2]